MRISETIHGVEFGTNLSQGVWPLFVMKQVLGDDVYVKALWNQWVPPEIWTQFADEFQHGSIGALIGHEYGKREALDHIRNRFMDKDFHLLRFDMEKIRRMPWPDWCPRPSGPYACFIPLLSERWGSDGAYDTKAIGRSMPYDDWVETRKFVNDLGIEVVGLGATTNNGLDKVDVEPLADHSAYMSNTNVSSYLAGQVRVMCDAAFTLSMGGGGAVAPTFGMPAITVDCTWELCLFPMWTRVHERPNVRALVDGDMALKECERELREGSKDFGKIMDVMEDAWSLTSSFVRRAVLDLVPSGS